MSFPALTCSRERESCSVTFLYSERRSPSLVTLAGDDKVVVAVTGMTTFHNFVKIPNILSII